MNRVDAVLSSMFVVCTIFSVSSIGSTGPCDVIKPTVDVSNSIVCGTLGGCVGRILISLPQSACMNRDESPCTQTEIPLSTSIYAKPTPLGRSGTCTNPHSSFWVWTWTGPLNRYDCVIDRTLNFDLPGGSECF